MTPLFISNTGKTPDVENEKAGLERSKKRKKKLPWPKRREYRNNKEAEDPFSRTQRLKKVTKTTISLKLFNARFLNYKFFYLYIPQQLLQMPIAPKKESQENCMQSYIY